MPRQLIEIEKVAAVATVLQSVNDSIDDAFDQMSKVSDRYLSQYWNSEAGCAAITWMFKIFKGNESRSAVIQNYINFLNQQVNPGYRAAEQVNTSLADQFK